MGLATQVHATDTSVDPGQYSLDPPLLAPYATLPQPNTTYVDRRCDDARAFRPDPRFPSDLPNAPYQITKYVPYAGNGSSLCPLPGAFVGDPLHRFYQMWQQTNEGTNALFTWVDETAGDSNGGPPPASTNQGALSMGFYNMAQGDAPELSYLAQHFSMSDNYHQAAQGGTMANHIALMTGNAAAYLGPDGQPTTPPTQQIENPDPLPGTNNHYTQDGYSGGSYSDCADASQPGVGPIDSYLGTLGYSPFDTCAPGTYYLLNNYNAPYDLAGNLQHAAVQATPQTFTTIGDELSANGIDWAYYGQGYHRGRVSSAQYCGVCDAMQYSTAIMTDPAMRAHVQHGLGDFNAAVDHGTLPAVSFVKPESNFDGHPGYSTLDLVRVVREPHRLARGEQPDAVRVDRGSDHDGRGRRLLRLRLRPARELPGRRPAHPAGRRVAVLGAGQHRPRLHRPRLDPQADRVELDAAAALEQQRGQPAEPDPVARSRTSRATGRRSAT